MDTFGTALKCPHHQGVHFQGFEPSKVSRLGPSVLIIKVSIFMASTFRGSTDCTYTFCQMIHLKLVKGESLL